MWQELQAAANVDWTTVIIALGTYAIGHMAGLAQMWMRLHRDAELGRSLRPRPPDDPATDSGRRRRR